MKNDDTVPADESATESGGDPTMTEVSVELGGVLKNYVELLDNANHGGWSRSDKTKVRSAVSVLNRATRAIKRRADLKPVILEPGISMPHWFRAWRGLAASKANPPGGTDQNRWDTDGGGNTAPEHTL